MRKAKAKQKHMMEDFVSFNWSMANRTHREIPVKLDTRDCISKGRLDNLDGGLA